MRLYILLIITLFFDGSWANSYQNGSANVFGIKAGLSVSSFWGDGVKNFEDSYLPEVAKINSSMLNFFVGGFFAKFNLMPEFIDVQSDLLFVRQGKLWDIRLADGSNVSCAVFSEYIMIPIIVKLTLAFDAAVTPNVFIGPQMALAISSKTNGVDLLPTSSEFAFIHGLNDNPTKNVKKLDVGMTTGIGFDIDTGPGLLVIDLRYTFGFLDTFKDNSSSKIKNSTALFMTGYALPF